MQINKIVKNLLIGIFVISSSNLFGMNGQQANQNAKPFKPQYEKHLKNVFIMVFGEPLA